MILRRLKAATLRRKMNNDEAILAMLKEGLFKVNYLTQQIEHFYKGKWRLCEGYTFQGYSLFRVTYAEHKYSLRKNRVIWMSKHGSIPEGKVIDHKNANKKDNRLENLRLLTLAENNLFRVQGRPVNKLSLEKAREIRNLRSKGLTLKAIAKIYGVYLSTVWDIVKNKHYPEPRRVNDLLNRAEKRF